MRQADVFSLRQAISQPRLFRQPHPAASRLQRLPQRRSRTGDGARSGQTITSRMARRRPRTGRCRWEAPKAARHNPHPPPRHELAPDRSGAAASATAVREGSVAPALLAQHLLAPLSPAAAALTRLLTPAREAAAALASAVPSKLRATWSISPWPPSGPGAASAHGRSSGRPRGPPWSRAHLRRMARAGRPPGPRPARSLTGLRRADRTVGSGRFAHVVRASSGCREPLSADHRRAPGARGRQR
jgi:hypothetical protein